jgi:flagellar FliL protein
MKKILPILKLVGRGLVGVLLLATVGITLAMAYIMFAPDQYPKPFYLAYYVPTPRPEPEPTQEAPAPVSPSHPDPVEPVAHQEGEEPPPVAPLEVEPGHGIMIDTGTKIINLAEPGGRKYIRVNIVLEYVPTDVEFFTIEEEEERLAFVQAFEEEINTRLPVINDTMITLLSSKMLEDVYTAEGKESLRQQIMESLNTKLPEYRVIFVYFTEFVVQ